MEFLSLLTDSKVEVFLLLLLRFSGAIAFMPFFDSPLISSSIKASLIFFLTLAFFPLVQVPLSPFSVVDFVIAGIFELSIGFLAGALLQIIFSAVSFASDNVSFAMGLTIASAYDPITGVQKSVISQVLTLVALLIALELNFHHLILEFIAQSLVKLPLGTFVISKALLSNLIGFFGKIFLLGLSISLPVLGIILLSDIIFGMIMKVHPQFNLLAIGFPVKIATAFICIIALLASILYKFSNELQLAFTGIRNAFFGI